MILGYLERRPGVPGARRSTPSPHRDEADRARAFARLGDALAAARQRYRSVKSFDEALFRNELGV